MTLFWKSTLMASGEYKRKYCIALFVIIDCLQLLIWLQDSTNANDIRITSDTQNNKK